MSVLAQPCQESSGEVSGVGFSDGRTWHEGRKFMLQNINNFVIKVTLCFPRCFVLSVLSELLHYVIKFTGNVLHKGRSGMALEDLVREEVMELIDLFKEKVGANGTKLW